MPNHSDQQLDDTIINALKYDAVVSATQKQRAWERLRNQVEAHDAILDTTPCCGGEIAEPERENILYSLMRRLTMGIGESLENSARFLFWDDLALTARPGCIPLHRRHIMMVGSFMVASA